MNKKLTTLIATSVLMGSLLGCNKTTVDTNSYLYIGTTMISEQNLIKFEGNNITYDYESNTLTLNGGYLTDEKSGYRVIENVYLGSDSTNNGNVGFLISYEGNRDLTINVYGDYHLNYTPSVSEQYKGIFYFKNDINVYFKGPGNLISDTFNHSFTYGRKADTHFENIEMDAIVDGSLIFGVASEEITMANCIFNIEGDGGYSGVYTGRGLACSRTTLNIAGIEYGLFSGTSYFYNNSIVNVIGTSGIGAKFYGICAYNTKFSIDSEGSGLYVYDPGTFVNCEMNIKAKMYFAINDSDTTLIFNGCKLELYCESGSLINAWSLRFNNSTVKGENKNGFGIYANFNANVKYVVSSIYINNTTFDIVSAKAALWSSGILDIDEDLEILNGGHVLKKTDDNTDITVKAICDAEVNELILSTDSIDQTNKRVPYPLNAMLSVKIALKA